ncbi:hypothetical protein ASPZODRAFT_67705 [Penicilliopsis zonata CBS 506.65]|uniref:Uncharacterized protein n=1 Tax=Penicilliopsis zonata CBS 506.65 TaxID=1073090 RepID=A0A1L9SGF0_9EURO|nr:hypothetical protein ASPZODRAFT_67705 [Penicilliopsis zonata CBS 506.65]OJJ46193.1 hypothetical protein ASPZODRAFT_67705 [Penicilliopsis zonata CBS 506.65]
METAQPPKQASYTQPKNPVSRTAAEQEQEQRTLTRQHGDATPLITRGASSRPSSDEALASLQAERERERCRLQAAPDVDTEYGVEQQPKEGKIAAAVQGATDSARKARRAQPGAHAGPVGSMAGPGAPGGETEATAGTSGLMGSPGTAGEQPDLMAEMDRKMAEHERVLGEGMVGVTRDPGEMVRREKLRRDEEIDVKRAVGQGTGDPVV